MSWDPFKPVDFGKKNENSSGGFFEPVNLYGSGSSSSSASSWGSPTNNQNSGFYSSSSPSNTSSHWSSTPAFTATSSTLASSSWFGGSPQNSNNGFSSGSQTSWAFSSVTDSNKQNSSWGGKSLAGDAFGYGVESLYSHHRKQKEESNWSCQNSWAVADQKWHFGNVSRDLERNGILQSLEDKMRPSAFSPVSMSSNAFSPVSTSSSQPSSSNWGFEPVSDFFSSGSKLKRW